MKRLNRTSLFHVGKQSQSLDFYIMLIRGEVSGSRIYCAGEAVHVQMEGGGLNVCYS